VQRAFHQGADVAVSCQANRVQRRIARIVAGGRDLERGEVDARGVGGARDRVARADQQRPGDAFVGGSPRRQQGRRIAGIDNADRWPRRRVLAARARDQRVEPGMCRGQT